MQRTLQTDSNTHKAKEASMGCPSTSIHHARLHATNPAASAEFYRDVLGMEIVGGSAFLSSRPDEDSNEMAVFANPVMACIAIKVSSLAGLRSFHARVAERNIPVKLLANHHASFGFYFDDPDGNLIEVYWPTADQSRRQPYMGGAEAGDLFISLIQACESNGADPFDYLTELQSHTEALKRSPLEWMPWNYRETLARLVTPKAA